MQLFCFDGFSWNKTDNPEPWNNLDPTYQYKVIQITHKKARKQATQALQ